MAILKQCCLFRNLRFGTYASVVYTLIYFVISCLTITLFLIDEKQYLLGEVDVPQSESVLEKETISATTVIFNMLLLICASFGILSSFLVIIGLRKNRREYISPWIFVMTADILVESSHFVYLLVFEKLHFEPLTATLFTLDFFIMCLNIYCLVCVISLYQELKAGRSGGDTFSINVHYVAPTQTCVSNMPNRKLMCNLSNCSMIPEETHINGSSNNKVDVLRKTQFQGKSSAVLKKVQFPDDLKGSENVTINIMPEDVCSSVLNIDMLPEFSEDILSWQEQNKDTSPADT